MELKELRIKMQSQPSVVDTQHVKQVLIDSIDHAGYGKIQLVIAMEEAAELIEVMQGMRIIEMDVPRLHLVEELVDTQLGFLYVQEILQIYPHTSTVSQYPRSLDLYSESILTLSQYIQLISKFVRGEQNVPRKNPDGYRHKLGECMQTSQRLIDTFKQLFNISDSEMNQVTNVKIARLEQRNKEIGGFICKQ